MRQKPQKNTRGVEVVTLHVQATEITLLAPENAERWVGATRMLELRSSPAKVTGLLPDTANR